MYKSLAKLTLLVILLVSILAAISSSRVHLTTTLKNSFPWGMGTLIIFLNSVNSLKMTMIFF